MSLVKHNFPPELLCYLKLNINQNYDYNYIERRVFYFLKSKRNTDGSYLLPNDLQTILNIVISRVYRENIKEYLKKKYDEYNYQTDDTNIKEIEI